MDDRLQADFVPDPQSPFDRYGVIDPSSIPALERVLRLAVRTESFPMAFISMTSEAGPSIVASLDIGTLNADALFPFLHRIVYTGKPLVVEDALKNSAFSTMDCVKNGLCRCYAGVPLVLGGALTFGTLSVMDTVHRPFSEEALAALHDLAYIAVEALEHEITRKGLFRLAHEHEHASAILRSVLTTAASAIVRIDEQGRILAFNPAAERLFGYAFDEVHGHNIRMLMPEPWASQHDRYMSRYCAGGTPKIIGIGREVKGLRKDRSSFPMHLGVSEVKVGTERQFTGIVTDLSALYGMQEDLAREKALFRAVLDSADNPLYACDLEGRYLFANEACQWLLGISPKNLIGQMPEALFEADMASRVRHTNAQVIATGVEIRREVRVGERRFYLKKSPLWGENSEIMGVVSAAYDITTFKHPPASPPLTPLA
jgi:PAS domain S-box-containing protein